MSINHCTPTKLNNTRIVREYPTNYRTSRRTPNYAQERQFAIAMENLAAVAAKAQAQSKSRRCA